MFRKLLLALAAAALLIAPAVADDDPQLDKIATMPIRELDALIAGAAASVGQDSIKMRSFAQTSNCLELTRISNSFALGYRYLGAARDTLAKSQDKNAPLLRARAIQARVMTFAARVRADEWLAQRCRDFIVPAEHAADPRYQVPAKVADPEYTDAVIDARMTAETNLALAIAAGTSGKCPEVIGAGRSILLLVPYLEKLLADTANRPQVLGPRASRRGLEVSRRQLIAAVNRLQADFSEKCNAPKAEPAPEAPAVPNPAK